MGWMVVVFTMTRPKQINEDEAQQSSRNEEDERVKDVGRKRATTPSRRCASIDLDESWATTEEWTRPGELIGASNRTSGANEDEIDSEAAGEQLTYGGRLADSV